MEMVLFYYAAAGAWVFGATVIRFATVVQPRPWRVIDYFIYCLLLWPHLVYRIIQKSRGV